MFSAGLFPSAEDNFQAALFAVIDDYIEKNKKTLSKRTGVARAKVFKTLILSLRAENLTREQLMWRLCSYIRMVQGVGPLDTSTELRTAIVNFLVSDAALNVDEGLVTRSRTAMYQSELKMMQHCAEVGIWYFIDDKKIEMNAKVLQATKRLTELSDAVAAPEQNFKNKVDAAIDAYINKANSVWYNRLFLKSTGIKRAAELKKVISQLVENEKLDDRQLCARILELASLPVGYEQSIFDTSKDLRNAVLTTMCDFLQLDENALLKIINFKATPHITPTPLGPAGYIPDVALVSINVRINHLQKALGGRPQIANEVVVEEEQRSALSLSQ